MTPENPVHAPLDTLASAHTSADLLAAHRRVRAAVSLGRKRSGKALGALAQTFVAAMEIWDGMKAAGAPLAERVAALEKTLRVAWPFTREWKFLCAQCDDAGLVMGECPGDATCGRHKPHLPHEFGRPCWCSIGARFRDKPKPSPEDFSQSGKMTKAGRR